jgi:hypothetical protein
MPTIHGGSVLPVAGERMKTRIVPTWIVGNEPLTPLDLVDKSNKTKPKVSVTQSGSKLGLRFSRDCHHGWLSTPLKASNLDARFPTPRGKNR